MKKTNNAYVTYSHCNNGKCNSISIKGDNIIIPALFGITIGILIAKAIN